MRAAIGSLGGVAELSSAWCSARCWAGVNEWSAWSMVALSALSWSWSDEGISAWSDLTSVWRVWRSAWAWALERGHAVARRSGAGKSVGVHRALVEGGGSSPRADVGRLDPTRCPGRPVPHSVRVCPAPARVQEGTALERFAGQHPLALRPRGVRSAVGGTAERGDDRLGSIP